MYGLSQYLTYNKGPVNGSHYDHCYRSKEEVSSGGIYLWVMSAQSVTMLSYDQKCCFSLNHRATLLLCNLTCKHLPTCQSQILPTDSRPNYVYPLIVHRAVDGVNVFRKDIFPPLTYSFFFFLSPKLSGLDLGFFSL